MLLLWPSTPACTPGGGQPHGRENKETYWVREAIKEGGTNWRCPVSVLELLPVVDRGSHRETNALWCMSSSAACVSE